MIQNLLILKKGIPGVTYAKVKIKLTEQNTTTITARVSN